MINHALYQISQSQTPLFTLGIDGVNMPFLATHFSLIIYLYLPIYWILGSYTPIFIQIAAILLAGIPVYKYAQIIFNNDFKKCNLILIHFYLIWGIYSALSFDFHHNVIGAMLVPWIILFLKEKKFGLFLCCSILMLLSMETYGIWLFFIVAGYTLLQYKNKVAIDKKVLTVAIFALIYSFLVISLIMPSLQSSTQNLQIGRYQHLGNSILEISLNILKNPLMILKSIYVNFNDGSLALNKLFFWGFILLSGGYFIIKNPILILTFIPPLVFKLLSKDVAFYGVYHQYSIEFVPLLSLVFIEGIAKTNIKNHQKIIILSLMSTIICTFLMLNFSLSEYDYKVNSKFFTSKHFNPELDVNQIKEDLRLIPDHVVVTTSNCLSPHLYKRTFLYSFPIIKDAQYLAIIKQKRSPWPLNDVELINEIQKLKNDSQFQILSESDDLIIFKTKSKL